MAISKRQKIALISLTGIILLMAGSIFYFHDYYLPESVAQIGKPLPKLTLQDINGHPVNIAHRHGTIHVLNFIQVDCQHCQNQLSTLNTLYDKIPDQLRFIVISTSSREETTQFFKKEPTPFPVWLDTNRNLYKKLGVFNVPALFYLDKNSILQYKSVGYQSGTAVRGVIDSLLTASTDI